MKKIFLFLAVSALTLTAACSSDDNSSSSNSNSKVVGKWHIDKELKDNSYTFNSNGTAVYVNYYQGKADVYKGAWKIIEGDILIQAYAEENEPLDKNWEKEPDMKDKIILVDDKELYLQELNSSGYKTVYYRGK